jgi:hypothetical protein
MVKYRIRPGVYERCNGYVCWKCRGFLAEQLITIFGIGLFWFPLSSGGWRPSQEQAMDDIERDKTLRAPLPPIVEVQ